MGKIFKILGYAVITALICSCSTTLKRYSSSAYADKKDDLADINLFMTKLEPPSSPKVDRNLWGLSDRGQEALIHALDARSKNDESFLKQINTAFKDEDGSSGTDFTSKDLKMIFSISRNRNYSSIGKDTTTFSPADRLEYVKFTLSLPTDIPIKFNKWNRYTTEYGTIDVGDFSFSQGIDASAGIGGAGSSTKENKKGESDNDYQKITGVNSITPSASIAGSMSKTETQHIKYRYIQLNGSIKDSQKTIQIEEEGNREIDLSGNVSAEVTLGFEQSTEFISSFTGLKDEKGSYNQPALLKILSIEVKVPNLDTIPTEIKATLEMDFIYRHVKGANSKTFYEWDDHVQYYNGTNKKEVVLFTKKDILPNFFFIGVIGQDKKNLSQKTLLKLKEGNNDPTTLVFGSNKAANDFLTWLVNYPVAKGEDKKGIVLGNYSLLINQNGDKPLTKDDIRRLGSSLLALRLYN